MTPTTTQTPTFRPRFTKFGPAEDYTGAQVLTIDNKLATIQRIYFREVPGAVMCVLTHFNGESFPEDQCLASLRILDRTWQES